MLAKPVLPGLYAIPVGSVNIFLLEDADGCILIDSGFPGSADKALRALHELGRKPSDVRRLLLTHAHPDHIGSAAALQKATGAAVSIHPLDAPIAAAGTGFRPMTPSPGVVNGLLYRLFVHLDVSVEPVTVEQEIGEGDIVDTAGDLTAVHVPGHSAGQVAFLWKRHGGVLLAADTCSHLLGLGLSLGYEDLEEGRRSLRKLARMEFAAACFGHGKPILHGASDRFRETWG